MSKKLSLRFLFVCAIVGISSGIGGYTFFYAKGLSYLSTDPKACVNCHVMQTQFDGWQKSSHHGVAVCADCHMPDGFFAKYLTKAENGYLHSKAFTLQDYPDAIQIRDKSRRILNQACLKCHSQITSDILAHMKDPDEINSCTRCHDHVGH